MKDIILKYRQGISPPYSKKDYSVIGATLLSLLVVAALVINLPNSFKTEKAKESHAEELAKSKKILQDEALLSRAEKATNHIAMIAQVVKNNQNISRGELEKEIAMLSVQRQKDLSELLDVNPELATKLILRDNLLSDLNLIPGAKIEKKTTTNGSLEILHSHYFSPDGKIDNTPEDQYFLHTKNKAYRLYGVKEFPKVSSGNSSITVEGYQLNDSIIATSFKKNNNSVLGATTGPVNAAVIIVNSQSTNPLDINQIKATFMGNPGHDILSYAKEVSFNKYSLVPEFYGPYTINYGAGCMSNDATSAAMNAANNDVNFLNYKRLIFIFNCLNRPGQGAGTAMGSIGETTVNTPDGTIVAGRTWFPETFIGHFKNFNHELGHNLGFQHARSLYCQPNSFSQQTTLGDNCLPDEYGDFSDTMGYGGGAEWTEVSPQYNAYNKNIAGWFDPGNYITVTTPGTHTYTLAPLEVATNSVIAISIPRGNSGTSFSVEYRKPQGADNYMVNNYVCPGCNYVSGANIKFVDYTTNSINTSPFGRLLFDSNDADDNRNGTLIPGQTFTDPDYGISIRTISAETSGVSIEVTIPSQSCTRGIPTASITPSTQSGPAGQTKTYTLTVTNHDFPGCPVGKFRIQPGPNNANNNYGSPNANDIEVISDPDIISLPPGASGTATVSVSSPAHAVDYNYFLEMVIHSNSGFPFKASQTFTNEITSSPDTNPPTTPSNLTANSNGAGQVNLSWGSSIDDSEIAGYSIYRNSIWIANTNAVTTSYSDFTTTGGSSYTYNIKSFDKKYNLSNVSSNVSLTTPNVADFQAPSSPATDISSGSPHEVTITWSPASDNIAVTGYKVFQMDPVYLTSNVIAILPANANSYNIKGLSSAQNYHFGVAALDADGNSSIYFGDNSRNPFDWKNIYGVYTLLTGNTALTKPTNVTKDTSTSANQVSLTWSPSTGGNGIAGYNIYRFSPFSGNYYYKIGTSNTTSFTDTKVLYKGFYKYYVQGYDSAGNLSAFSQEITTNPPYGPADSVKPSISITSPSNGATLNGTVNLSSSASDNVGVVDVQYNINPTITNNAYWKSQNPPSYNFLWDTTNVPNGTYTISSFASDAFGNQGSAFVTVTVNNTTISPTPTTSTPTNTPLPTNTPTPTSILPTPTRTPTPVPADTIKPIVAITTPTNGATVPIKANTSIVANATDNVGVARVEFLVSGTLTCTDTGTPYGCTWKVPNAKNKTYTLSARAYDGAGNSSTSSVNVTTK